VGILEHVCSRDDFIDYLALHCILCVYRTWAARDDIGNSAVLTMMDRCWVYAPTGGGRQSPAHSDDYDDSSQRGLRW
jgi:hypothetical protein